MTWYVLFDGNKIARQISSIQGEDIAGLTVVEVSRPGKLPFETLDPATSKWVDDMEAVRAALIEQVDSAREARQQAELTSGTMKAMVYGQKLREVDRYRLSSGMTRTPEEIDRDFPATSAEMAVTGDTLSVVIDRISVAADQSNREVYRLDAIATWAKEAIRSASTAEQARAAATVDWEA